MNKKIPSLVAIFCFTCLCINPSVAKSQNVQKTKAIFAAIDGYAACVVDADKQSPIRSKATLEKIARGVCGEPRQQLLDLTPNDLVLRKVDERLLSILPEF